MQPIVLFVLLNLFLAQSFAVTEDPEIAAMEARIKPIGEVTTSDQIPAQVPTASSGTTKLSGEKIYQQYCTICHKDGIAGAPKTGDLNAWQKRAESGGLKGLINTATQGKGAMPPKGTCTSCGADDIQAAILYMLPEQLKKIK